MPSKNLPIALLILRLSIGSFLLVWASLKFFRPEWMVFVFTKRYGLEFVTADYAYFVGTVQVAIAILFIIGYRRTILYGFAVLMHGAGVVASIPSLMNYTQFPNNLLWTSVATWGALIALFLMREADIVTVDEWLKKKKNAGT